MEAALEQTEPEVVESNPKQDIKELISELKLLKSKKDSLFEPINEELFEIEEKKKQICDTIIELMQSVQDTIKTNDGAAIYKQMPNPHEMYDKKALDSISDKGIREILDRCKKMSVQGEPKVVFEIY